MEKRAKISPVIVLLTFHAPVHFGVFNKFKMDSQDIIESNPELGILAYLQILLSTVKLPQVKGT